MIFGLIRLHLYTAILPLQVCIARHGCFVSAGGRIGHFGLYNPDLETGRSLMTTLPTLSNNTRQPNFLICIVKLINLDIRKGIQNRRTRKPLR